MIGSEKKNCCCDAFALQQLLHTPRRAWKGMHMRTIQHRWKQREKQIVTKELEIVAQKEHMTTEELMPLVAEGKVVICANKNHTLVLIRKGNRFDAAYKDQCESGSFKETVKITMWRCRR